MYELLVRRRSGSKGAKHYNDKNSIYRQNKHHDAERRKHPHYFARWVKYQPARRINDVLGTTVYVPITINYK